MRDNPLRDGAASGDVRFLERAKLDEVDEENGPTQTIAERTWTNRNKTEMSPRGSAGPINSHTASVNAARTRPAMTGLAGLSSNGGLPPRVTEDVSRPSTKFPNETNHERKVDVRKPSPKLSANERRRQNERAPEASEPRPRL